MNFKENWICREVPLPIAPPARLATVAVLTPKLPLAVLAPVNGLMQEWLVASTERQMPPSGFAKLGWLKMLKKSVRNWICEFSVLRPEDPPG